MKPPAPRNRECDAIRSLRSQLQVALIFLRVVLDRHDFALYLDLTRNGLLAFVTHDTVSVFLDRASWFAQLASYYTVFKQGNADRRRRWPETKTSGEV